MRRMPTYARLGVALACSATFGLGLGCDEERPDEGLDQPEPGPGPRPTPPGSLTVDTARLDFGPVTIGARKSLAIVLTNTSTARATTDFRGALEVTVCGAERTQPFCLQPVDRDFVDDLQFTLGAGEAIELELVFDPPASSAGELRAGFTLSYCEQPGCELAVALVGEAVETGLRCEPEALDFGDVNPGASSERFVTCENVAFPQITLEGAEIAEGSSDRFFIDSAPRGAVLTPPEAGRAGGQLQIPVGYAPRTLGLDAGTLRVLIDADDAFSRVTEIPLRGRGGGPDIEVRPASIDFGEVSLLAPARRAFVIRNVGVDDLRIDELVVDSLTTGAFASNDAGADVIPPGGRKIVTVEFQPQAAGAVETRAVIRSNDVDEAEFEIPLRGEGVGAPACDAEVAPSSVDFGDVAVGRTASQIFVVRNVSSTSECLVTGVALVAGSDPELKLQDREVRSTYVPPGARLAVRVDFQPIALGRHSGVIEVSLADPDRPVRQVSASGTGVESTLLADPGHVELGVQDLACARSTRRLVLHNPTSSSATVTALTLLDPEGAFELSGAPSLPATIAPGGALELDVGFTPSAASDFGATLEVEATVAGRSVRGRVSLRAAAAPSPVQTDRFEQLGRPQVDMLFIVDDGFGMEDEQRQLADELADFLTFAEAQALGYRIAVTSADLQDEDGRFVPLPEAGPAGSRIVTPETEPSPVDVLGANVRLGSRSRAQTRVFDAMVEALSALRLLGHNAGFRRPGAALTVVAVTDGDDASEGGADLAAAFLRSAVGPDGTASFSAIAGGEDGCTEPTGGANPSPRLVDLVARTGGTLGSVCTPDWSRTLEDVSRVAFGFRSRFFLSNTPDLDTLEVFVDEERLPGVEASGRVNWTFDEDASAVDFTTLAVPAPGAAIRVEYSPACE